VIKIETFRPVIYINLKILTKTDGNSSKLKVKALTKNTTLSKKSYSITIGNYSIL